MVDPVTVGVNDCVADTWTEAVVGETETDTAAPIVTVAEALLVGSAALVAVMFTVAGKGTLAGAV